LGETKLSNLFDSCTPEQIVTYFFRELEHTWRMKLIEGKSEQIVLIIDLKAVKLKDLQNKRANGLFGGSLLIML
jgi:hypothetical protein